MSKVRFILLAVIMAALMVGTYIIKAMNSEGYDPFDPYTIVLDAGGDIGNYNTTASMEKSTSNPYPYNELETLCKEWMALPGNEDYKVVVAETSYNGSTSSLRPLLNAKTAPDVIYMNGTTAEEDKDKGWFEPLKKYLMSPNVYCEEGTLGSERWIDLYGGETEFVPQSDGEYYYINMERIPIGIIYNTKILEECGISYPFSSLTELINAEKKISQSNKGYTYLTSYRWLDIQLESNMFAYLLDDPLIDIDGNKNLDLKELISAYKNGKWAVDNDRYKAYLELVQKKTKYYPRAYESLDALSSFVGGRVAFMEGTGAVLRQLSVNTSIPFTYKIMPYPTVEQQDLKNLGITGADSITNDTLRQSRRGTAGYGTSWWVTNTAQDKGQKTVDKIVDLLMFLTAPEQNNRLVSKLGGGIPLNPNEGIDINEYLKPLLDLYVEDAKDENKISWAVWNSWNVLGTDYSNHFMEVTKKYINAELNGSHNFSFANLVDDLKGTTAATIRETEKTLPK